MSRSGSWLILIDSDKQVTNASIAEALRQIEGAEVSESETACGVVWRGCSIAVGISELPHVLVESKEMAEQYGAKHKEQKRIARCARRFEVSFQYEDAPTISNVMCEIESYLALLVEEDGGRTFAFNPQTKEFF